MRKKRAIAVLLFLAVTAAAAGGDDLKEKVRNVSIYGNAENMEMEIRMVIHENGREKERTLKAFVHRNHAESKVLIHIISPAYLNRMKFLSIRDGSGRESRWLRTSQVKRRLSENDSGERLFGSDFTVEDLSAFSVEDYTYFDLGNERINSILCSVIKAVPKAGKDRLEEKHLYIDDAAGMLVRVDFFHTSGDLYKQYMLDSTQRVEGKMFPRSCFMKNLDEGSRTELFFEEIEEKGSLPARYFNQGNL